MFNVSDMPTKLDRTFADRGSEWKGQQKTIEHQKSENNVPLVN